MIYEKSLFNKIQKQEGGMIVELDDDAMYLIRGVGFMSFQMPSNDVLELSDILSILGLRKNFLLVSCMMDVYWSVYFEGK